MLDGADMFISLEFDYHGSTHYRLPLFFFFNDTATTEIYTLSLHDALPIFHNPAALEHRKAFSRVGALDDLNGPMPASSRSEEHTSELQSRQYLVCRLLLEKKKKHLQSSLRIADRSIHPCLSFYLIVLLRCL